MEGKEEMKEEEKTHTHTQTHRQVDRQEEIVVKEKAKVEKKLTQLVSGDSPASILR